MFAVIEMQTNGNTTAVLPVITKEDRNNALSAYHSILASAAISKVEKHTALVIDENGGMVAVSCFEHKEEENE